jgi:hypothetical protein
LAVRGYASIPDANLVAPGDHVNRADRALTWIIDEPGRIVDCPLPRLPKTVCAEDAAVLDRGREPPMKTLRALTIAVSIGLVACSASSEDDARPAGAGAGAGGAGDATGAGAGDALDASATTGGGGAPVCPDVDLLFVIDDSGSMGDNQENLAANFPVFAQGIEARLTQAQSLHVGVVATDDYYDNVSGCGEIGNLIVKTGGPESSGQDCGPFTSGAHYIDETEPDLAGRFACIAKVGAGGSSDERPARALMNAVDPARNAQGACNAGFLREDALLVVVIISDEDDVEDGCTGDGFCDSYGSGGTPEEWFDAVVAAKGGHPENVVMLSLIGTQGDNACGAVPASHLMKLTHLFDDNGYVGDVCASSYDEFFLEALPVIDDACVGFVPPPK